jgi:O-antigen biosynthesis protein
MNILFSTSAAPALSPFSTDEKRPPLGIGYLMSVVRTKGHNVFFVDNYLQPTNFVQEGYLQKNSIDFVCIYASTICYKETLKMLTAIEEVRKEGLWNGKVVVGGPHTSVAPNTVPEYVDFIVQGEGERAILAIITGQAKSRIVRCERIKDLDSLPFPAWDVFAPLSYDYSGLWMDEKPVLTMNTSRGCPHNCSFCSVDSVWGQQYTSYSAARIVDEIEYLMQDFGAKGVYFREDNFTLNIKRTFDFCQELTNREISIAWACETRVDTLCNEELVRLMSEAGCKAVYLGVESGSQRILDFLNKKITTAQVKEAVRLCKKYEMRTYCSLIVGVPTETFDDYLLTKKLMEELEPFAYTFNIFVGIPDSELYKYVIENDLYEYVDDLGLAYLPGFDVKAKYFYDLDSRLLVDYEFRERTDFDNALLTELNKKRAGSRLFKTSAINSALHIPERFVALVRNRLKHN